jgi:CheY-specific phosphatase CheX
MIMISDEDLLAIAEEICFTLFEDEAPPPVGRDDAGEQSRTMTAIVDIQGDWNGSVSVRCRRPTADRIAAVMFDCPAEELSRDDVIDALGEFANMAAGSVKGMLEGDKKLGLPTVTEGVDYIMVVPHTIELLGVEYPLADDMVRLAVHQLDPGT